MDNLPKDIEDEILLRLSNKSIICLSSVCKSWRSRILNPDFVNLHMMNIMANPDNHSFIAHCKISFGHELYVINMNSFDRAIDLNLPSSLPTTTFKFSDLLERSGDDFNVVGSCKGLLCLAYKCNMLQKRLYLWNPATRQVKDISEYTITVDTRNRNLDTHNISFGFGFDIVSRDYKVVRIVTDKRCFLSSIEVYSLNENSWKEIEVELKFSVLWSICPAVVKGLLYWFIEFSHQRYRALVSFDVQNEKFCIISLPDGNTNKCYDIFEFKQSIALIEKLDNGGIRIWIPDDNSCWSETSINMQIKDIFGCLKTGEFVAQHIYSNQLFLYDPVSNVVKRTPLKLYFYALRMYNYSESLVNLNFPNGILPKKQ